MDTNPNVNAGDSDQGGLPPELAQTRRAVDRLADAERAAAGPSLEDRVFIATRIALAQGVPAEIAEVAGLLDELAATERAGASVSLDDRIMLATAARLPRQARVVVRPVVTFQWRAWSRRAVAAMLVVAAGGAAWWASRPVVSSNGIASLEVDVLRLAGSVPESSSPLAAFNELRSDLDSLDRSVGGDWFRTDPGLDEESM